MRCAGVVILAHGFVSAVGLSSAASCAALRAKATNPTQTRFTDPTGAWVSGHQVELDQPWRGSAKLVRMAVLAIEEALQDVEREVWSDIPVLICEADPERPGARAGADDALLHAVQAALGVCFSPHSAAVRRGKVGPVIALAHAARLLRQPGVDRVIVAASDSMLSAAALSHFGSRDRLLTQDNSNGFMPGEAAGALLVGRPGEEGGLQLHGFGFGREEAHVESDLPLRGDGLTRAVRAALDDAAAEMHDMDCRVADVSGEQYYFKEASLALNRTLRQRKGSFELWHPAECIGETGAAAAIACFAVAHSAARKGYALGPRTLLHFADDNGERAAAVASWPDRS